jgi:hypothetical protein
MKTIRNVASIALLLGSLTVAETASAQTVVVAAPPPSVGNPEAVNRAGGTVAAILGLGIGTCTGCGAAFGFGLEGGYTFPFHLYVGANFTYFAASLSSWVFEPQVGYDLAVFGELPILLRPYLGLGYQHYNIGSAISNAACAGETGTELALCQSEASAVAGAVSTSAGGFLFSPGIVGEYAITPHIFAGADVRFDISTISGYGGVTIDIFGTGGYRF